MTPPSLRRCRNELLRNRLTPRRLVDLQSPKCCFAEKNNSKNRSHLKRKLEAMQRDTESAQKKRRRQRRLKSYLPRRSLDSQIQSAEAQSRKGEKKNKKEPER